MTVRDIPPLREWRHVPPPKYKKDWPGKPVMVRSPTERAWDRDAGEWQTKPDSLLRDGSVLTVSQRYPLPVRNGEKDAQLVCLWTCPCCGHGHKREYLESRLDAGDLSFVEDAGPAKQPHVTYLAAPYSHADPAVRQERWLAASHAAAVLMRQHMVVLSPLSMGHPIGVMGKDIGIPTDFQGWRETSLVLLRAAQILIVLTLDGWRESEGVAAETGMARELGMRACHLHPTGRGTYVICAPWQSDLPATHKDSPRWAAENDARVLDGVIWHEVPKGVSHE
jgi:hypothetical protein